MTHNAVAAQTVCAFFVQGKPVPQPRPRAGKGFGGHARVYEADREHGIHNWKDALRFEIKAAMGDRLPFADEGVGLRVELVFQFPRPKPLTKKKWADKFLLVTNGKDVDNLAKSVLDVCNGRVWDDDRRVSTLLVRKQYVLPDQAPGVRVGVFIDEPLPAPFFP